MAAVYVRKHPNPKSNVCEVRSTAYQPDDGSPPEEPGYRKPSGRSRRLLSMLEKLTIRNQNFATRQIENSPASQRLPVMGARLSQAIPDGSWAGRAINRPVHPGLGWAHAGLIILGRQSKATIIVRQLTDFPGFLGTGSGGLASPLGRNKGYC
jgi:hypothetical protein